MQNKNKILVLLGVFSLSILLVENIVMNQSAFVYIYDSRASVLSIASAVSGFLIGYGMRGGLKGDVNEDDISDF